MMSKILMIADIHFGFRNKSLFNKIVRDLWLKWIIPYCKEHSSIDSICILGDVFESRTILSIQTHEIIKDVFSALQKLRVKIYIIAGNHDYYYSTHNDLSFLRLFEEYKNVTVIHKPSKIDDVVCIPWIFPENEIETFKYIRENKGSLLLGHFSVEGFKYNNLDVISNIKSGLFKNYNKVLLGHIHQPQKKGNIRYIGMPYWGKWDLKEEKLGAYVYDTKTEKLEFVENKISPRYYEFSVKEVSKKIKEEDFKKFLKKNFIRLIIDKSSELKNEKIEQIIQIVKEIELPIFEVVDLRVAYIDNDEFDEDLTTKIKSPIEFLNQYIGETLENNEDLDIDKQEVDNCLSEIVIEVGRKKK